MNRTRFRENNVVNINSYHDQSKDLSVRPMLESSGEENRNLISSIMREEDDEIKQLNNRYSEYTSSKTLDTPSTIVEVDEQQQRDLPSQSLSMHFQQTLNNLTPTPPHRIRQDSSCSSTNSIRYVQFIPPCLTTLRGRRVIQSILLNVQRKKVPFEKLVNTFKNIPIEPTMYELGLEFLRLFDGKFNYPQGHTFVMFFRKRTWFLTIVHIECIECYIGQIEPRSVLMLKYKNQFASVQV